MPWAKRPILKPSIMPDRRELVYVSAERFEAVLKERGLYDLDQVARDIGTYPDTLKYRLRMGSFLPYMAKKLESAYGITPQDYAPIILLDTTGEDSPVLTDEEVERIAERVAQKIATLIK